MRCWDVLGEVIKRERVRQNWSQRDLADKAGLAQTTISLIETNKRTNPGGDTLQKLAGAFGLTVDVLLHAAEESTRVLPVEDLLAEGLDPADVPMLREEWALMDEKGRSEFLRSVWDLLRAHKALRELERENPPGAKRYSVEKVSIRDWLDSYELPPVVTTVLERFGKYLRSEDWAMIAGYIEARGESQRAFAFRMPKQAEQGQDQSADGDAKDSA